METYHNPFLHKIETKVKNIQQKDGFLLVELEDTIFYPGGGGQPHDKGIIKNENFHGEIDEVSKNNGKIIHKIKPAKGKLNQGDSVICEHDIERRLSLLRMHSGEHIFVGALLKIIKDIKVEKINLREDESSLFVKCNNLTWEQIFKAERVANQIIKEGRDIIVKDVSKEEAKNIKGLRIKLDRIKDEKIRIVEIKEHDVSACAGVHALKTDFIGNFLVTKFNLIHGSYEIRFKTNISNEFFDYADIARKTASIIKKDVTQIPEFVENLIKDNEEKTSKLRELSAKIADDFKQENINDINFIYNIFEGIEKKQLTDKANSFKKEKTVICFINKIKDNSQIIITCSDDSGFKANELLKSILEKFDGKGGGRENFAMGAIKPDFCDKAIK
ncbi:MAG: DHHA1 domain-containing protein, partial [Candidatus Nanoarchaeia archaeon]|nr:DHHA1 domain-containing protein [Candidatus Nanoarchaeia archaeon]